MESSMKYVNNWLNQAKQSSTFRELSFLVLVVVFVVNSLPVSVMGNENIAHYFFAERATKILATKTDCFDTSSPCEVKLTETSQLQLIMPAQVAISDGFEVLAQINGVKVERVSVLFKGVDHSHGLLPQAMREVSPQNFQVEGLLNYCGYKRMAWLALVTVYTERTIYETSFAFESIDAKYSEAAAPLLTSSLN